MLLYKYKTNHDLPIKNIYKSAFLFKKAQLISNVGDCENMNHMHAFLAQVIKIWYNCCKLFSEEFIFLEPTSSC